MNSSFSPQHRLIKDLSDHEIGELDEDFGLEVEEESWVLALLSKAEWQTILGLRKRK